jgi:hypothetical protein
VSESKDERFEVFTAVTIKNAVEAHRCVSCEVRTSSTYKVKLSP